MSNLIPKKTKVKVDPDKLTDSQKEIIRCLANGRHIYIDNRNKYRMSTDANDPNDHVSSGHGHDHLYRPTIIFFIEEKIIVPPHTDVGRSWRLVLNDNYDGKFRLDIDGAMVEAALGVRRNTDGMKRLKEERL